MRLTKKTKDKGLRITANEDQDFINIFEGVDTLYRDLFNNISEAVFVMDLNGNIKTDNEAATILTGYTHGELTTMNISELLARESFKLIMGTHSALANGRTQIKRHEIALIRKDNSIRNVTALISPVLLDSRLVGTQTIIRDSTDYESKEGEITKFLKALETVKGAVHITSADGKIIYANEAMDKLFGYQRGELIGRYPSALNAGPAPATVTKRIMDAVEKEGLWEGEIHNIRKDGTEFLSLARISALVGKDGRITNFISTQHNITDYRQTENSLQESVQKYKELRDSLPQTVFEIDEKGNFTFVNRHGFESTGYTLEDIEKGLNALQLFVPQDTERVMRNMQRILGGDKFTGNEYTILRKDGSTFPAIIYSSSITHNGKAVGLRGVVVDITERKQAEQILQKSEAKYRNLVENAPIGITISTPEGRILDVNKTRLAMGGYDSKEEYISRSISEHYSKDRERWMDFVLKKGKVEGYEVRLKRKDGTLFWGSISSIPQISESGEQQFVIVTQDVTERKQAEEALRISEQNFRNSLEDSPLGIRIVTAEGELLYANKAILDIYGYSSFEELRDTPRKERYTSESYAEHQLRKEKRRRGELVLSPYELSIIRKDGEIRHLVVHRKEVVWGGENQFQTIYYDITEQRRMEKALKDSEEFNASLCANSPTPLLVINADTSIRYVNPALEKITGFSSAELIGKTPPYPWWIGRVRKASDKSLLQIMRRRGSKPKQPFKRKDGEIFWVETNFRTVEVSGEFKYYLENWVDLTDEERLTKNLEFYISQVAMAREEEQKRISRDIHDDSVQALAALALNIDSLSQNKERLPKYVSKRLEALRAQANNILDGLRRLSHELRPAVLDQVGLVPALELLTEEMNADGFNTTLEVTGAEQRLEPMKELMMFRIAQESLRNIKKHSGATKSTVKLKFTRKKARLTIFDNGKGFQLPKTLDDLATDGKLGLIGMQERANSLNAKFLLKSREHGGSRVVVEVEI